MSLETPNQENPSMTVLTFPLTRIPAWAVLERRLFDAVEEAWRVFDARFCDADGRVLRTPEFDSRDGVDDLYEPFFNWPTFYALGGSDEILASAKRHWEGVTAQLTEGGMLTDEYENGYDWFHQGESLIFLYALSAADPDDAAFAERARRFAELYTDPRHGNWDPEHNIIRAPHNGALGPLPGLGPQWQAYSADQPEMRKYGLPLDSLPGIESWDDLADEDNARRMGQEMQRRAAGDVAVNLAATTLAVNRWLYDADEATARWVIDYIDGWRRRAADNDGLIPDNVSPDGRVGGLHDGAWHGGHYGWTWPHGLETIGMATVIAAINHAIVSGSTDALDLARATLDASLAHAIFGPVIESGFSLTGGWKERHGEYAGRPGMLVPHRYGRDGWFDYGPPRLDLPLWLWWFSRDEADLARLRTLLRGLPHDATEVIAFRDKAEAGHEAAWLSFLLGEAPDYPVHALEMALGQVSRRVALMTDADIDPTTVHLHFWQRVNPVVTEVLSHLVSGAPQILYNGGLPLTALRYRDEDRDRPGLPADVAALVTRLGDGEVDVELVNLSQVHVRRVRLIASSFALQRITAVRSEGVTQSAYPGRSEAYASPREEMSVRSDDVSDGTVIVELAPAHAARLTLTVEPETARPHHDGRADASAAKE
ncbi:hypothetical protein [Microbacterium sp. ZW T5_56]|uniref:hypothetical protein n=1 Tax=Microbacterium sp. ZW T5_56 TaxID=3378081 RepID=UPI003853EE46